MLNIKSKFSLNIDQQNKKRLTALVIILMISIIGVRTLIFSHAQSPYTSVNTDSGTVSGRATVQTDPSTSNGKYVQFGPINGNANNIAGAVLGDYIEAGPSSTNYSEIDNFISSTGSTPGLIQAFFGLNIDSNNNSTAFPTSFVNKVSSLNSTPMVVMSVSAPSSPGTQLLNAIGNATPAENQNIKDWAKQAKNYGKPLYIRLMWEFNGEWYPWGLNYIPPGSTIGNGATPAVYKAAYINIVQQFQAVGANNVQFVWCVSVNGDQNTSDLTASYPGDQYVDWVAMDGYNRNGSISQGGTSGQQTFSGIFSTDYNLLTSISKRPVMIAETAAIEDLTNPTYKSDWITNNFSSLGLSLPKVKAVLYFDGFGHGYCYPFTAPPLPQTGTIAETYAPGGVCSALSGSPSATNALLKYNAISNNSYFKNIGAPTNPITY